MKLQMKLSPSKCHLGKPMYTLAPYVAITVKILGNSVLELPSESTSYFFQKSYPLEQFIPRISLIQAHLTSCLVTKVAEHTENNISG